MPRSCYIVILIKSKKDLELVFSLQHWAKIMLETFVMLHTSIWLNFGLKEVSISVTYIMKQYLW